MSYKVLKVKQGGREETAGRVGCRWPRLGGDHVVHVLFND